MIGAVSAGPLEVEAVRKQLDEIIRSAGFARSERLSQFLRFIVERQLEGRASELKEVVIGAEVFGRSPDYSPKTDPIVRTEARRLRERLSGYYEGAGSADAVIIDLPKGGYVPVIRPRPTTSEGSTVSQSARPFKSRKPDLAAALVSAGALAAIVGWVSLGHTRRDIKWTNSAAYGVYLRAHAAEIRPACTGVELASELFQEAIARDPSFAPAYSGLASMMAARSGFDRFTASERTAMISTGWAAVRKAMQLDSHLADTYDALAMMQAHDGQWRQAEANFRRAIELAPREPLWRDHFTIFFLLPLGRIDEAKRVSREIEAIDSGFQEVHYALTLVFRAAGQFDDADFHCHHAAEDHRQMSLCWADTFLRQGKADSAVQIVETAWNGHLLEMNAQSLGVVYARAGRRADAERVAGTVPRPAGKAVIFAALGDKNRAFEILEQMLPMGPTRVGRDLIAPEYAVLRGDPRLSAIRRRVGLPD